MEFFNFENNFEIEVNHPQAEVFTKFETYVSKKTWKIIHSDHKGFISFQTRTALIAITFIANNDNSTTLSITTKTEQFDYNRNLGIIHKILKECLSEQIDNVEEEHNEVQYSNSKPKQKKKQRRRKTYDNDSKRKVIFVATIALFAIVCLYPSVSSYIKEHWNSPNIEYAYESKTNDKPTHTEPKRTDIESWMVGKWKGSSYVTDWNNNNVKIFVNLEIDKYGNATQFMQMQGGSMDVEQFTLKYDRSSQVLYYREGGLRITYQVNPSSHTISVGDNITLYKTY